jgi:hypothetical protein
MSFGMKTAFASARLIGISPLQSHSGVPGAPDFVRKLGRKVGRGLRLDEPCRAGMAR